MYCVKERGTKENDILEVDVLNLIFSMTTTEYQYGVISEDKHRTTL